MQGARILVVDDEPAIRSFVVAVLQSEGYEVHEVSDGRSALAAIQAQPPDLVLLDMAMPVLSGDRVLRQLSTERIAVPVIMMTAGVISARWRQEGVAAILPKPFDLTELLNLVALVLSGRH
ncbi:MAG: response regulator [Chloroflexales bacterium]|nr:response regulator [Chloroflexales bacterium]